MTTSVGRTGNWRMLERLMTGLPLRGTVVRSTTITPVNGALATGVRKMPLIFWAQPHGTAATKIRKINQEKLTGADCERIGTLRQHPAPAEYQNIVKREKA